MKQEVAHIDMFEIFTKNECKSIQKPARCVAQRGYCASQASIVTVTTSRVAEVVLLVTGVVMFEVGGCRKIPPEAEGAEVVAADAEVLDGACAAGEEVVATGSGWGLYVVGAGSCAAGDEEEDATGLVEEEEEEDATGEADAGAGAGAPASSARAQPVLAVRAAGQATCVNDTLGLSAPMNQS
jgi:hypothetical protein